MPRKGHSEEQIITALRQVEAGKKVSDVCREMGVSQQAFYSWKRKYAGLALNELRELRQLREENRKLKTLVGNVEDGVALQQAEARRAWARAAFRTRLCSKPCYSGSPRSEEWSQEAATPCASNSRTAVFDRSHASRTPRPWGAARRRERRC